MIDNQQDTPTSDADFAKQVQAKASRKIKARRHAAPGIWFGLGMMGLIGWSVVVPTLVGAGLGIWLDGRYRGPHSWTLALLIVGLAVGCANAWHWVITEERSMHDDDKEDK